MWSAFTAIESSVLGKGTVHGGVMTISFDSGVSSDQVAPGMMVTVGDMNTVIDTVGTGSDGGMIASARLAVSDGDRRIYLRLREAVFAGRVRPLSLSA